MTETPPDNMPASDDFGLEAVRELLNLISSTDITEIQIERGTTKLHIKRGSTNPAPFVITPAMAQAAQMAAGALPQPVPIVPQPAATFGHAPVAPSSSTEYEPPAGTNTIVSPMVGTFYASASPKDPAFVNEGDAIQAGDVVGIVEAMKIMNEVDSEYSGRVVKVLVSNGQPVEYGQPLMVVEPL